MHKCSIRLAAFGLIILCGALVLPPAARAQSTMTIQDLKGTQVAIKIVREMINRRNDRPFSVRVEVDWMVNILRDGVIQQTRGSITHSSRGTRQNPPGSGVAAVDQPQPVSSLGGGHMLWTFKDDVLTMMRTFRAGAYRAEIAFKRSPTGLTCSVREVYAREDGNGKIELDSAFDGRPYLIISSKQISSSCRVTKTADS